MTNLTPAQERTLTELMDESSARIDALEDAKKRGQDPETIRSLAQVAALAESRVLQYEIEIGLTGQSLSVTAYNWASLLVDAQLYGPALAALYSARLTAETPKLKAELAKYATFVRRKAAAQAVETGQSHIAIQMSREAGQQFLNSIRSGDPKMIELLDLFGLGQDANMTFYIEGEAEPIDLKKAMEVLGELP
jgi:hypothetical protein